MRKAIVRARKRSMDALGHVLKAHVGAFAKYKVWARPVCSAPVSAARRRRYVFVFVDNLLPVILMDDIEMSFAVSFPPPR